MATPALAPQIGDRLPQPQGNRQDAHPPAGPARKGVARGWRLTRAVLSISWPLSLLFISLIAAVGFGVAVVKPGGFGTHTTRDYVTNNFIDFRPYGDALPYLVRGWQPAREAGRRTAGEVAELSLRVSGNSQKLRFLTLSGRPVFAQDEAEFWVDILINGQPTARWVFQRSDSAPRRLDVPIERVDGLAKSLLRVSFVIGSQATRRFAHSGSALEVESLVFRD